MKVCNRDESDAISDGFQAPTNIPWHVRLEIPVIYPFQYPSPGENEFLHCSGTILDKNTVLTSANCVEFAIQNSSDYLVFAGFVDKWDQATQRILVNQTFIHPHFDPVVALTGNIAVLKLKTPLDFENGKVQPACLPESDLHPIKGEIVVTSGWGLTQEQVLSNTSQVLIFASFKSI